MRKFKFNKFNLDTETGAKKYEELMDEQVNSGGKIMIIRHEFIKKKRKEQNGEDVSEWEETEVIVETTKEVPAKDKDGDQVLP